MQRFFAVEKAIEIRLFGKESDALRSEEHTSELQSQSNLVCRLLLEKKKNDTPPSHSSLPPECTSALFMVLLHRLTLPAHCLADGRSEHLLYQSSDSAAGRAHSSVA